MTATSVTSNVLAGDIGGTKTNLALFMLTKRRPRPIVMETYRSADYASFYALMQHFLDRHVTDITAACVGIAGPVIKGYCKATNLPWEVSESTLRKTLGIQSVVLLNDLEVTARGIPLLGRREMAVLNKGQTAPEQACCLVAPGTGLGMAIFQVKHGEFFTISSEGGHVDFAPLNSPQIELWRYLHARFGHVSVERLISGPGLINIYSWLKDSGRYKEPGWLQRHFGKVITSRMITTAALERNTPICVQTVRMFVSILGSVAGNLALTGRTIGGVYLGGGIPPKIIPLLMEDTFMQAFTDKGRFRGLLETIPVHIILNDTTALWGAAQSAFEVSGST